jgi:hypothetical protein
MVSDFSEERSVTIKDGKTPSEVNSRLMGEIFSLSGSDALKKILSLERPEQIVRSMSRVDLFWLIKKVGDDDALPLLQMASDEQWQHIVDMELWSRDRIEIRQVSAWLGRLQQADVARLARWLCGEGQLLAHLYFSKKVRVEVRSREEVYDGSDGFITFDNVYFFKVLDPEHEETIRNILQHLASVDFVRYQAMLLSFAGVLPAELEEEMYRLRNVRLAEDGFLPYEEAISAYTHINGDSLKREGDRAEPGDSPEPDDRVPVPLSPMIHTGKTSLLAASTRRVIDPVFADRVRLEFAGLCNQVIAADGVIVNDLEVLLKGCRKTAGFISLGLERLTKGNLALAEEYLRNNPLIALFRLGFSLALELKWDAERWMKQAWFRRRNLEPGFWGEEWGGILAGLVQSRPRLFDPRSGEGSFREFDTLSEIAACRTALERMIALDRLLEKITSGQAFERKWTKDPFFTFHALIFTFWARVRLGQRPGFEPLPMGEVKRLFKILRKGERQPPYRLTRHQKPFADLLMSRVPQGDGEGGKEWEGLFSFLWEDFVKEYALVEEKDLDGKFLRYILTAP